MKGKFLSAARPIFRPHFWKARGLPPGLVVLLCLAPAAEFCLRALAGGLSANPIDDLTDWSGTWTLRFLMLTLSVTPLRRLTGWQWVARHRRTLGLSAFAHGCLHLMTYLWLDQFFDLPAIVDDIAERRFITAGATGFLLMVPLALTSTRGWIARLGGRRWQRLHRLVYASAAAGVIHYLWLVKLDIRRPLIYGCILGLLLGFRVVAALLRRRAPASSKPASGVNGRSFAPFRR